MNLFKMINILILTGFEGDVGNDTTTLPVDLVV